MAVNVASLLEGLAGIAYVVDRRGVIEAIGRRHWRAFAAANGGEALLECERVIGRSLFEFIQGEPVAAFYRRCLETLFAGQSVGAHIASRCDGPGVRRELAILVTPIVDDGVVAHVLFQSVTVAEHERPPIELFDFAALARRAGGHAWPTLVLCDYCQAVRVPVDAAEGEGRWISAEDYHQRGGDARVRLVHGVCPPCLDELDRSLRH